MEDHAAFAAASRYGECVLPVFIFDKDILARFRNRNDRRLTLIVKALCTMHHALSAKGGGLLALYGRAEELIPALAGLLPVVRVVAAEDGEPASRKRDAYCKAQLGTQIPLLLVKDHVLHGAGEVLKEDGTPYRVFTPYARAWRANASATSFAVQEMKEVAYTPLPSLSTLHDKLVDLSQGVARVLAKLGYVVAESEWDPDVAWERLEQFTYYGLGAYHQQRDFLGCDGTSRLSPYLRFGVISVRECARRAMEGMARGAEGASIWLNELIWRDFFSMMLVHHPHSTGQELLPQYRNLPWSKDKTLFSAFIEGKTGYPVVDAAMRELLTTGFMHNRARMIVASFMTKHLLLDWRMGEEHFAQHLMDYDLASNVGGWQWAASTGVDAQPYFRIFNPVLQGKKFDGDGEYVRRFVPELAHLPMRDIHEPWKSVRPAGYPAPIVEHAVVKEKVLSLFSR